MFKDSSCLSSPQPPANVADAAHTTTTSTTTTSYSVVESANAVAITTSTTTATVTGTAAADDDAFSCPSESSSDSEFEAPPTRTSRPSTTSTTSSSTTTTSTSCSTPHPYHRTAAPQQKQQPHSRRTSRHYEVNADVRLLRKIGYIASRVRFLAKLYGDFKLVNPYSPAKQRRQLQEILLHHSIGGPPPQLQRTNGGSHSSRSLTPVSSIASSYCCLQTESSLDDETTTVGTVRRKSSASAAAAAASIVLLEDLLIQFYEDHRNKVTVIRRRRSRRSSVQSGGAAVASGSNHLFIMSGQSSSSVERLLQLGNDNDDEVGGAGNETLASDLVAAAEAENLFQRRRNFINANATTATVVASTSQQPPRSNVFLQPSASCDEATRRRRSSDCSMHPAQPLSNQLQVTLKNNNCAKFPFHRGSCGAAGEHLLAANSIANRSTIILSKSCSNVDGSAASSATLYASSDLRNFAKALGATSVAGVGNGISGGSGKSTTAGAAGGNGNAATNGNANEYSVVQLNNTIIQCHFNDDDFRALVKDLKRKVEYTERMNWLCLSKRPLGPPHRKSSLPKHQEVKKRFLEICDTTFSDEVKAALRLPAFDSYEWSDADVICLMQTMFIELGFIEKFHIPMETLREWLYEVYKHYNEVPFHNFRHCFCVAQMMYAITRQANLLQRLGDLECLILLVSCICHDLDHPGYNNIYQINARTELALRYNDISPLENHHCSIAFRLLEHPECNIFKHFSRETFNQIREGIIRCILATDMARHNEILTQFKEVTPIFDYSNRSHINLLCMILIKVADISNEARPMDVAEPWLDRLLQEFFAQSAAEKSEGLPVTPFMDPDKVSKPGSQVRFIGLVLLPLFEALGDLVPELIELIIIPVRVALDYYKRLNDAQNKSRKSVAETSSNAVSESNSCSGDVNATAGTAAGSGTGAGGGSCSGGGSNTAATSATHSGGSISPQMPRSQSGISVKSRRSIPSQKSASRTSVDEPTCIAAELHDLPEGSESGDSETATEVDVAEKTSKFKVDTEGSSNRSKSSHSTSRKSSREKRPSMIGEMCSAGGGQRIRNSYGNIHGYHSNRCHFGSNRAVSLDQYSCNNRRLSDGLQQVISDSNVFYNRHNRCSLEAGADQLNAHLAGGGKLGEDLNMNATIGHAALQPLLQQHQQQQLQQPAHICSDASCGKQVPNIECAVSASALSTDATTHHISVSSHTSNGNCSPTQPMPPKQHCCAAAAAAAAAASSNATINGSPPNSLKPTWKARFKQFSDYFTFSFDRSSKRCGSTRSSPCSVRNNNATSGTAFDPLTGKPGVCCTISNNLQSTGLLHKQQHQHELISAGRNRAYSLDVPCNRSNPRYSSSSGGESRKSSRNEDTSNRGGLSGSVGIGANDDNNSNNTLHSCGGSEMPICLPPPIRIGSVDASDHILITSSGLPTVITPANLGEAEPTSLSIDLGMASGSSSDPPKI